MFGKVLFEHSKYFWWHYYQTSSNIFRNSLPPPLFFEGFFLVSCSWFFISPWSCLHTFEITFITKSTNDLPLELYKWQIFQFRGQAGKWRTSELRAFGPGVKYNISSGANFYPLSEVSSASNTSKHCILRCHESISPDFPCLCSPNLHSIEVNARMPGGERIAAQDKEEALSWK